jgi:sortase A
VKGWRETQTRRAPSALAVLRIPSIGLQVPVLEGTDQWTLNRAVGHIEDTSEPGMDGNAGIAGHRDGFFRGLKDIRIGDVLELETPGSIGSYRVDRTWIVDPDDVSVLDPTASPAVTLVTCYPFYFVGSAPQRFIVRAVRMGTSERQSRREE